LAAEIGKSDVERHRPTATADRPVHVHKGYKRSDSVVSIFGGWSISDISWYSSTPIHEVIRGRLEHFFSTTVGSATIIMDPTVAADVAAAGFNSKEAYADYLARNTGTPA
jgi:hypothetical protein